MDVFTHFVLPYCLMWALRRPVRERVAAGVGGVAPDMDVVTALVGLVDDRVWFLGHRGLSHSAVGAPLYALAFAGFLTLPHWGRRWPRLQALRFDARMLVLAALFSYTHLVLDGVTMWGVPLAFPWSSQRYSLDWYFYSVAWAIPFSLAFLVLLWRQAPERRLKQAAALLVLAIVASGAARVAWRPHVDDAERTLPIGMEWQWATVKRDAAGYEVTTWSFGDARRVQVIPDHAPPNAEAQAAVDAARASPLAKGFLLYAGSPVATQVELAREGGWNVTFTDVMRRAETQGRAWAPAFFDDYGILTLRVDADGTVHEVE